MLLNCKKKKKFNGSIFQRLYGRPTQILVSGWTVLGCKTRANRIKNEQLNSVN